MKNYRILHGSDDISVPRGIIAHMKESDGTELKALLLLASCGEGERPDPGLAGLTAEQYDEAMAYLRGAGLVSASKKQIAAAHSAEGQDKGPAGTDDGRRESVLKKDYLPEYKSSEIKRILENDSVMASLLEECQGVLGKVFNTLDSNTIIALHEELKLDGEYILLLCADAAEHGKNSVAYVRKVAVSYFERDIVTPAALEEELKRRDMLKSREWEVRKLLGTGERALTKKEGEVFSKWLSDRQYSSELLQEAYELTVKRTGKAAYAYMDKILDDWHSKGYSTADDVRKGEDKNRRNGGSSFEENDFFRAAVEKSLGKK